MSITDVPGIRVGHWTDAIAATGCTVVLAPAGGAVAGGEVRGGAPGTREMDLLQPGRLVSRADAICLSGGSAFGLAAADGVMRFLRERGRGFPMGAGVVPIVPAAVIYDLGVGSPDVFPGPDAGYAAALAAERGDVLEEGRVGAGTGATVGKALGPSFARPGGVGTASVRLPSGTRVGALAVVNALGDVVDHQGRIVAGATGPDGPLDTWTTLLGGAPPGPPTSNTTIAVIATDADLTRPECQKLCEIGQDGLAMAIRPVHTPYDGDTLFCLSAGSAEENLVQLGVAAAEALRLAIERAVRVDG
ncbi:MAG TPA: P1 family peptidase [Candidatus Dormibacteraeota bacterium]|nr:P1 family peptidase [Candidatus Dormibacteraeota bacterium]